ncbi:MAG: glycosyltransferase family 39 protein [Chloroflexota bacterium]
MRTLKIGPEWLWLAIHSLLLAFLVSHRDTLPTVLNRYSTLYALLLLALVVVGIAGLWVLWQPEIYRGRLSRLISKLRTYPLFYMAVCSIGVLLMLAVWLTPFAIPMIPLHRQLLRCYATGLILGTTYLTLFAGARERYVSFRLWVAVSAIACFAVLIIAVHYLDRFPQLNQIDELHNWSAQWTFAHTGLLGEAMYRQMIPLPQPILDSPHYLMGFLLRYIGDTLWQSRFARMLLACLALPFIYLLGKMMYGKRTGVFAVVVAAFLIPPTAYVRPDVFVGVMLSVALYVYWRAQTTRRPWMHYLTGLCVALCGEGHPLAYRFGLAFALIYGVRWLYEMWQTRRLFIDGRLFALGLGGATGMLIYLSIHILPNTAQGLHFATSYGPGTRTSIGQFDAALGILQNQLTIWVNTSPLESLFVALGVALALSQNKQPDRLLLTLLAVSELLLLVTYAYYRQFYQAHFLPIFALLAGRFLANFTESHSSRAPAGRLSALVLASMVFVVGLVIMTQDAQASAYDPERDEFTAIARDLKADLPADAIVVGNENYFLEMRSMNYYGIQTVTTNGWYLVNYQGYKLWEVTKPDIFILSGEMDTPKYTDLYSIYSYMQDHNFMLARCYTHTGLIEAQVYVRQLPPGWIVDPTCKSDSDIQTDTK